MLIYQRVYIVLPSIIIGARDGGGWPLGPLPRARGLHRGGAKRNFAVGGELNQKKWWFFVYQEKV